MGLAAFVGPARGRARRASRCMRAPNWLDAARSTITDGVKDAEWRDAELPMVDGGHWDSPYGDVLTAVFACQTPDGPDRVLVAFNRGPTTSLRLPQNRAGFVWRVALDTSDDERFDAPTLLADRTRLPERAVLIVAETPVSEKHARAPDLRDVEVLSEAAGIAGEWFDVTGRHTIVSDRHTNFRCSPASACRRARRRWRASRSTS